MQGLEHLRGYFDAAAQAALLDEIRAVIAAAPLFVPCMPGTGRPFSVRMTNCGALGWVSDKAGGYRYEARHPVSGRPWPPLPPTLLQLWERLSDYPHPPEACLVNVYHPKARMGMHRDTDEQDFTAPLISVSLGATAIFRIGGLRRRDPARAFPLLSGDVLILRGEARLAFHGVDRILLPASPLEGGERINLTLRRVTLPAAPDSRPSSGFNPSVGQAGG